MATIPVQIDNRSLRPKTLVILVRIVYMVCVFVSLACLGVASLKVSLAKESTLPDPTRTLVEWQFHQMFARQQIEQARLWMLSGIGPALLSFVLFFVDVKWLASTQTNSTLARWSRGAILLCLGILLGLLFVLLPISLFHGLVNVAAF